MDPDNQLHSSSAAQQLCPCSSEIGTGQVELAVTYNPSMIDARVLKIGTYEGSNPCCQMHASKKGVGLVQPTAQRCE